MMTLLCAVFNSAWAVEVTDVLTRETTGVTGTSYSSWSDVRVTSNAVYAGQSAGGNESIQLRSNNNNSGIITTTSGGKVKSITVTWNSNTAEGRTLNIYGSNTAYTNPTELYSEDTQGTLLGSIVNGESTSLTVEGDYTFIGIRSKSAAMYLDQIEITWESASAPAISAPTFSPKGGTYHEPQSVTISCATEGASIYYTTNGAEPTTSSTKYSAPITISATTTIKAISVKGSEKSSVASAIYTIEELTTLANIAALSSQTENGNYSVTLNNAVVTYVNGNYAYMQDASGAILYYKSGHGLTAGQKLNGTAEATLQIRNSNPQITNLTGYTASDGTAPEPKAVTASAWSTPIATVLSQYLKVTGATITKTDNKFYVQLGSENVQLYGQGDARTISVPDLSATYTIVGFPTMYNTTPELQIFVQPEAEGAVKPAAGLSYGENGTITITYGEAYTLPTLSNPNNLTVTYTSSHEDIATVDEKGTVTPTGKAGQTTIKATFEGNDKYLAGDASYLLVVNVKATPGTDVYELVTDASSLKANDQIIIVSEDNLNALSTTQNTNNRAATDVATESDGTIKPSSLVQVITLEQSQGGWYFNTGNGYLYAPSSSANQLRTQDAADEKALVSTLTIAEGIATVQFNQWVEGARTLLRFNPNNGNPIFNCYAPDKTTGTAVRIYRNTTPTPPAGAKPTISGTTPFTGSTVVTITPSNEDYMVYYTTDGSNPQPGAGTTKTYSKPFTITETTTVKAVEEDYNEELSAVAEKTFTKTETATAANIAAFKNLEVNTEATLTLKNAQVVWVGTNDVYVRDESGAIDFYQTGLTFTQGQVLNGTITGKYAVYNKIPELAKTEATNADGFKATSGTATPKTVTIAAAKSETYYCDYIKITGVKIKNEENTSNIYAYIGEDEIMLYDKFKVGMGNWVETGTYDVEGILVPFKDTYEIYITKPVSDDTSLKTCNNIAEFKALNSGTEAILKLNNAQVVYAAENGKDIYVRDASGAIEFYDLGIEFVTNNMLNGTITGKYSPYRNLPEIVKTDNTKAEDFTATAGSEAQPKTVSVADLCAETYLNDLVEVTGTISIVEEGDKKTIYLVSGEDKVTVYDKFRISTDDLTDGDQFTIKGIGCVFNTTWQIMPISFTKTDGNVYIGDSNGDGIIDVTDVMVIVDYVLGKNPKDFIYNNANWNGDNVVDITDAMLIVYYLLGKQ